MNEPVPFDQDALQREKSVEFVENLRRHLDRPIPSTPILALPSKSSSRPFGFVASEIEPLAPPSSIFIYEDIDYEKYKQYLPLEKLIPPPAATPPAYTSYPLSPIWTLEKNPAYLSGWCYTSDCSTSQSSLLLEKSRMNTLATPPQIVPIWNPETKSFDFPEVPGMVQMVPGVSYSVKLDGNPNESLFAASVQTKETLLRYPGIGDEAVALLESLTYRVWGDADKGIPPLYANNGLQRNQRSVHPDPKSEARLTGSFSLAGTLENGYAAGRTVPANQSTYKEGLEQRSQALMEMGRLYRLIAKICLPKNEYDLIDAHAIDNNTFGIGGLAPSPISVQMNVSFLKNLESLIEHIGALQGKWHVDQLDCLTIPTLFLLFLRLPEGSDPGPFLLGRLGLYCREVGKGMWVISIMFWARDPHSGSSPWVGEGVEHVESLLELLLKIKELWPTAELINRIGFVLYWSTEAVERSSALYASPETRFGNHGTLGVGLARSLNFVDNGQHFLGTEWDARSRLGWEHILNFYNALNLSGLDLAIPFSTLVSSVTYRDSNTQTSEAIIPYPIDPSNSHQMEQVQLYRQYYKSLLMLCRRYSLHLTKSHYLVQMKSLSEEVESSMEKFGLSEYLPIQSALNENLESEEPEQSCEENGSMDIDEPEPIPISQVLDRSVCREKGEVFWHIQLANTEEKIWVSHSDGKKWMFTAINRPIFLHFINENKVSEFSEVESSTQDSSRMSAAHTLLSLTTVPSIDGDLIHNPAHNSPSPVTPADNDVSRRILRSSTRVPGQHDIPLVQSLPPRTSSKKTSKREARKLPELKPKGVKQKAGTQSGNAGTPKRARVLDAVESEEDSAGSDSEYEIERITGHTFDKGAWMFSVVWKGYLRDNSRVSRDDLKESAPVLYNRYATCYPEVNTNKPSSDAEGSVSTALSLEGLDILLRVISVNTLEDCLRQLEARYQAMTRLEQ
ncbi:hypothetical protein BT96DRAFT_673281 [Gymnopus androsaceus JB14]|uniref:Chromo domain-containing protein n=1 Tax=Gymnopus androsaceus JB14 TaxID=1447944 RepID=A0A6A4HNF2_9AGAR|nr:hypothetical protein BT96DRAFT_673281 [Gymnopus androsaceus JB14]